MNCFRTGHWHENNNFPMRERGRGRERKFGSHVKVNNEVVLRNKLFSIMLCVFTFPMSNSKVCMTDKQKAQAATGQVKARWLCPFNAVTRPELHSLHLACGPWPADFTHDDRTAALMSTALSAMMKASYTLQSLWQCQSDLSIHRLRVSLHPFDSSVSESLGKTQTWQRQAGKFQPRMTLYGSSPASFIGAVNDPCHSGVKKNPSKSIEGWPLTSICTIYVCLLPAFTM